MSKYVVKVRATQGVLLGGLPVHVSTPMEKAWAEAWADVVIQTNKEAGRHAVLDSIRKVEPK